MNSQHDLSLSSFWKDAYTCWYINFVFCKILTGKNINGSLMNHLFVVVVRGLEEKLFILTKEKENLEDELNALQQKVEFSQWCVLFRAWIICFLINYIFIMYVIIHVFLLSELKMQDTEEDTKSTQSSVSTIQKDLQTLQVWTFIFI